MLKKIKEAWSKLPLKWRKELTSVSQTFIATFGVFIATQVNAGELMWTKNGLMALGAAAARAALKAAFNSYIVSTKKASGGTKRE